MVQFEKASFVIRIDTGTNPVEDWLLLHDELLSLLSSQDKNMMCLNPCVLGLLRDMMPDYETAKRMSL